MTTLPFPWMEVRVQEESNNRCYQLLHQPFKLGSWIMDIETILLQNYFIFLKILVT